MFNTLLTLLNDYTFQIVALGTGLLGAVSGLVGSYVTLRKESLLGDTIGHAALLGITAMFMIIQAKITPLLLIGALMSGLLAVFFIQSFTQKTVLKLDSAMALVITFFFGGALVIMTFIQGQAGANQAGLSNFIFGQASAMLRRDVYLMIGVSVFAVVMVILFWQPFKLLTFDRVFAESTYTHASIYNALLSSLIVLTIMIGLETVGVILISSLLIAPSIAGRQWTDKLFKIMIISAAIGLTSGVIGTIISSIAPKIPTGPAIVVILSFFALVSLIIGPKSNFISNIRTKNNVELTGVKEETR